MSELSALFHDDLCQFVDIELAREDFSHFKKRCKALTLGSALFKHVLDVRKIDRIEKSENDKWTHALECVFVFGCEDMLLRWASEADSEHFSFVCCFNGNNEN